MSSRVMEACTQHVCLGSRGKYGAYGLRLAVYECVIMNACFYSECMLRERMLCRQASTNYI